MKRRWKQKLSALLTAALVLSTVNVNPFYVSAVGTAGTIIGFEELDETYALQYLPVGAEQTEIEFPTELRADLASEAGKGDRDSEKSKTTASSIRHYNLVKNTATASNATASDAWKEEAEEEDYFDEIELSNDAETGMDESIEGVIGNVKWVLNKEKSDSEEFNSEEAGTYVYDPIIPTVYTVGEDADLPQITVLIGAGEEPATGLEDGILTLVSEENGSGTGWNWAGSTLNINGSFSGNKQIVFAENVNTATIKVNSGVTLTPDAGQPAIKIEGDLTIDTATEFKVGGLINGENITITNTIRPADRTGVVTADGAELFRLESGQSLTLGESVKLSGTEGGSIYLEEGAKVSGAAGMFSDRGNNLTATGEVVVTAETEQASAASLTAGEYAYDPDARIFAKAESAQTPVTGLEDGILTLVSEENGSGTGWNWAGSTLNINGSFSGNKQIVFAENVNTATIKVNSGVTLTPDAGQPAIKIEGDLTIDTATEFKVGGLINGENITITNTIRPADRTGVVTADGAELFRLESGQSLTLGESVKLSGTEGGSIYLEEGAKVSGAAGMFSDRGNNLTATGEVVVTAETEQASAASLTAGEYAYDPDARIFAKAESAQTPVTGLEDGILTLVSEENGSGTGWNWAGSTLNINGSFSGNKQIVFAENVNTATIKVNSGVTLTPDAGQPAIKIEGDLTIDTATEFKVGGLINGENITITNTIRPADRTGVVTADGAELFRLESGQSLTLGESVKLSGTEGGSISLNEGAKVSGAAGMFSDDGILLEKNDEVTVGATAGQPSVNGLREGSYVFTAGVFAHGKPAQVPVTGLKDGILTLTADKGSNSEEGWDWNKGVLNVNSKFLGVKQILFAEGINTATIKVNSGVTLTPDAGQPAIKIEGDLTIDTATEFKVGGLINGENITITNTIRPADRTGVVIADGAELFRLESGQSLTLGESVKLSGTEGGSISLNEGAKVSGAAGMFSDDGILLEKNDEVTVGATAGQPSANGLREGSYVFTAGVFAQGKPAQVPVTGLKDGILTLTADKGSNKEEGWDWNKGTLNVNRNFVNVKQIVLSKDVNNAVIKLNSGVVLTPEAGRPAITATGDLTITADNSYTLTLGGAVEAKSLTVKGNAGMEADGAVTVDENITIVENASMVVKADAPEPAMNARNGGITIGGTATVIVRNHSGAAMSGAPDISGYEKILLTASENAGGKPEAEYRAEDIDRYRYLRIEKKLTASEIETSVEALDENTSPEVVGALADQIRGLSPAELETMKPETLEKVDQLLQKATGIQVEVKCRNPLGLTANKRISEAEIHGALLAADIAPTDNGSNTQLTMRITQTTELKLNGKKVLTFEFELYKNEEKTELKTPVEVIVKLPAEFYPKDGFRVHLTGDGMDEWRDFIYHVADNTTSFWTDRFTSFTIENPSGSGNGGGSGSSGGSGGSSGGSGPRATGISSQPNAGGGWIKDSVGWWYQNPDKSYPKDGWAKIKYNGEDEWYFFDKNGYMLTGWVNWNGKWYYMSTAPDGTNGIMLTGWQIIDGKRYYFSEAVDGSIGVMLTDIQIQEYYLGSDGVAR